jgi:hypothetical protein
MVGTKSGIIWPWRSTKRQNIAPKDPTKLTPLQQGALFERLVLLARRESR